MSILITGGAGYIGSHTCTELLAAGEDIVVLDNFSNSSPDAIDSISEITGKAFPFYEADILDSDALRKIFSENDIEAVIHFAALKSIADSVKSPDIYYKNNVSGTLSLLGVMAEYGCKKMVFSSSASVYGSPLSVPIKETAATAPTNPYGETKVIIENKLREIFKSDNEWGVAILRYFNPIGSHASGLLAEKPLNAPSNLLPCILSVISGEKERLEIYGDDYPTPDGTCIRDYIHITDLATGHIKALDRIRRDKGVGIWNLGTGKGYSVLEIVKTFENVCGVKIPYTMSPRRNGDVAECFADTSAAEKDLGWKAVRNIEEMCSDYRREIRSHK